MISCLCMYAGLLKNGSAEILIIVQTLFHMNVIRYSLIAYQNSVIDIM